MAFAARRCVNVNSSWVAKIIQGCNNEYAVQFKGYGGRPGPICYYFAAPAAFFNMHLAAPSKGKFVHQNLYRTQPYKIIADPCPAGNCKVINGCCPSGIDRNVVAVLSDAGGFCACLDGVEVAMSYSDDDFQWRGSLVAPCGSAEVILECDSILGNFFFDNGFGGSPDITFTGGTCVSVSCDPVDILIENITVVGTGCSLLVNVNIVGV